MGYVWDTSPTLTKYKDTMERCLKLYYRDLPKQDMDNVIDYSIRKRYKKRKAEVNNSYTKTVDKATLLSIADYIEQRHPIVTAYGTMFEKHCNSRNLMAETVQSFLDLRSEHKKTMFKFPKGSEDFEKYNLLQQLDKIDANGIRFPKYAA